MKNVQIVKEDDYIMVIAIIADLNLFFQLYLKGDLMLVENYQGIKIFFYGQYILNDKNKIVHTTPSRSLYIFRKDVEE